VTDRDDGQAKVRGAEQDALQEAPQEALQDVRQIALHHAAEEARPGAPRHVQDGPDPPVLSVVPSRRKAMGLGLGLTLSLGVGAAMLGTLASPAILRAQTVRKPLRVATTFTIIQDIAQNVAGEVAIVGSITRPGAEVHGYQPTPLDVVKAQSADLVLWNGLNLELWFERSFENVKAVPSAVLTEGVTPLPIREGPYEGGPNPHAWMSVSAALISVENIRKALAAADPGHAAIYAAHAERYAGEIRALEAPLRQRLMTVPEAQRWLVTSEGAFSYRARDFGFREAYLWPINADEQGTSQQVRRLIDLVRRNRIPVVFSESTVSDRPARQVARETGARYGGVLYVDRLSDARGPVPT
jgi:manganese/iron transport system substrate-binding protein